jgi:hypothetical protein
LWVELNKRVAYQFLYLASKSTPNSQRPLEDSSMYQIWPFSEK